MASIYVHLSGKDIDDAIMSKVYGKKIEALPQPSFKQKVCPRCGKENPPDSKFCNCGMALDLKAVMEIEKEREKADELMSELIKDPEVQAVLERKLGELIRSKDCHF
jgi:ribosomal protein L40E